MGAVQPPIERIGAVVRSGRRQPISAAVAWDRLVFVSGQVPMVAGRPSHADIAGQTHATLDGIAAILADAGCTLADVVKTTVWLTDASDYAGFNAAYAERFPPDSAPARSTVIAGLIAPVKVEIEAVAVRPAA
ncbi:RidA family protein [Variovorax sp. YR216]|uniref:RidA family protein n=1 Tax=Variovorax sp. YR216 TaxID=1882828 RepID=UPI0008947DAC|nr:RidA family protein [Variovorax sp. YR216]SEB24904.1 reactive intermediate/imine deaminase [Variovorax sp. YR216]